MIYNLKVNKTTGTHYAQIQAANVQEAELMVRHGQFDGGEFTDENLTVELRGERCKSRTFELIEK